MLSLDQSIHATAAIAANNQYSAYCDGEHLTLLRQDLVQWTKRVPYPDSRLIGAGNNGVTVLRSGEGIHLYRPGAHDPVVTFEYLSKPSLENAAARLGGAALDEDGKMLCVERVSHTSNLSTKLLGFLKAASKEGDLELHQLLLVDLAKGTPEELYKAEVPRGDSEGFRWSISENFQHLAVAETQKQMLKKEAVKVVAIEVAQDAIVEESTFPAGSVGDLRVSNAGVVALDLRGPQGRSLCLMLTDGSRSGFALHEGEEVRRLSRTSVCMINRRAHTIVVRNFGGVLQAEASFGPLLSLGIELEIAFGEVDEVNLLTRKGGQVKVIHSTVDRLFADTKRWQGMEDQRRQAEQSVVEQPIVEAHKQARTHRMRQDKIQMLASSVAGVQSSTPPSAAPAPLDSGERARLAALLQALEERFITGAVSEPVYVELRDKYQAQLGETPSS